MNFKLKVWRQHGPNSHGQFQDIDAKDISEDSSFLEMLDVVNERLEAKGEEPIVFDHDCREGICGSCGMMINGLPNGGHKGTTACQLHMRSFQDGDHIVIEPFRARAFPVVKDLMVNRDAFDRVVQSGGYVSVNTGVTVDANALPISKEVANESFDSAACIGCGACVASCKNASAMLFVSAKANHLNVLPQGKPEANKRTLAMVETMDAEGFGHCTNTGDCEATCPKEIKFAKISKLNRGFIKSLFTSR